MSIDSPKFIKVVDSIYKELMVSKLSDNIGLHVGTSGVALFLTYYDRIIQGKHEIGSWKLWTQRLA